MKHPLAVTRREWVSARCYRTLDFHYQAQKWDKQRVKQRFCCRFCWGIKTWNRAELRPKRAPNCQPDFGVGTELAPAVKTCWRQPNSPLRRQINLEYDAKVDWANLPKIFDERHNSCRAAKRVETERACLGAGKLLCFFYSLWKRLIKWTTQVGSPNF